MRRILIPALLFGLLTLPAATAHADTFGFECVTNNNAGNCAILEAQMEVEVTSLDANTVQFEFSNSGPLASSIAQMLLRRRHSAVQLGHARCHRRVGERSSFLDRVFSGIFLVAASTPRPAPIQTSPRHLTAWVPASL